MCELAGPDIEVIPAGPLLTKLAGTTFHGHEGLRTLANWSYENYPHLRLESSVARKVPGWIQATSTFIVDDGSAPAVTRHTETLFDVNDGLIRSVRAFIRDSQAFATATGTPVLTAREREVFQLLASGLTGPEIAQELVLSPATVRTHVQNGVTRLGAKTRLHALALAVKQGEFQL
jgi:DNA-binding CsgD family transcriptional regulator